MLHIGIEEIENIFLDSRVVGFKNERSEFVFTRSRRDCLFALGLQLLGALRLNTVQGCEISVCLAII